jgi:parvulin-like peptidyl-prolyl isomerase
MMFPGLNSILLAATLVAGAPAPAPSPSLAPDVILLVNGEPIRLKDLDLALFLDDHAAYVEKIWPFLLRERVVRQKMSEKGISVRSSAVIGYMRDLDKVLRTRLKKTLRDQLKSRGMSEAFFKRYTERALGLYYLAGGKGRPFRGMSDPAMAARMKALLENLVARARTETDMGKLPSGIAGIVNGEKISMSEAGQIARIGLSEKVKRERLQVLVYYFLARQELRKRKLQFGKDDMEFQIRLVSAAKATKIGEKNYPLEQILKKLGRDVTLLKRQYGFKAVAILTKLVRHQANEKELRKTFEKNRARFGDGVPKASQIYFTVLNKRGKLMSRRDRRKKQDLAEKTYKKLVNERQDFAKVAGEVSEDNRTAGLGGNLGFIPYSKVESDAVARTAYRLKVGEISRPIFGRDGWHIVKVTEINRVSFDTARPAVLSATVARHRSELLNRLRKKAVLKAGPAKL